MATRFTYLIWFPVWWIFITHFFLGWQCRWCFFVLLAF